MTGPDHPRYSPQVAFGLYAQTAALKAKTGQLRQDEPAQLLDHHDATVPDDLPAHLAVIAFIQGVGDDPVAAGDALIRFLGDWHPDGSAAAVEAGLRDQVPEQFVPRHDWQTRKDAGFD